MDRTAQDAPAELQKARKAIFDAVLEGLKHGFFDYAIHCEVGRGRRREMTLKAGMSHRFVISEDELSA